MTLSDRSHLQFYLSPGEAWDAMLRDCQDAVTSIQLEQYILMNDALGQSFLQLLTDKARQGIQVKVMLDRVGSRTSFGGKLIKSLRQAGATIEFYNTISWLNLLRPNTWFPRNHSKNLVVDGKIAYVGSVCLAEHMRYWRDTQIRFTGPMVEKVERSHNRKFKNKLEGRHHDLDYVATAPKLKRNILYKELLHRIQQARKRVLLVTPYFLPPRRLMKALVNATKRGVDVQIMLSRQSDVPIADYTSQTYYPKILRQGMRIFLYDKSVLHAKYMVVDDDWATVGSTNLDYLSLLRNRESNLILYRPDAVQTLVGHYMDDKKHCQEIDLAYYKKAIPWHHKLLGRLGHSFRWVL